MSAGDAITQRILTAHRQETVEQLKQLHPSPYFTHCEFETEGEIKKVYFAKFSFNEEKIYSWITPAAALRFETIGQASYTRPDGSTQSGNLLRKDQYLIANGKIIFLATESIDTPRELIYQENFTREKSGFILPEVVELMEKAQDQVIRAPHQGPLIISGPAGSGKTTLALHRVAYLTQSPETADFFQPHSILVLVQDAGTRDYFSHLLPELGIKGVSIITFNEWALDVLNLPEHHFSRQTAENEFKTVLYEYAKLSALQNIAPLPHTTKTYTLLEKAYVAHLNPEQRKLFEIQKKQKILDRFDLTILLHHTLQTRGTFSREQVYYEERKNGTYQKKKGSFPVTYNLMIIDEFQNYLPEQLRLIKKTLNPRLKSIVYVGDLAQQTQLGTVRDLQSIDETVKPERLIQLQKVYRNTRQILSFIKNLGYNVFIPDGVKEGKAVVEITNVSITEEVAYVREIIAQLPPQRTIGIIAQEKKYLDSFQTAFEGQLNVHCLSMYEAQGVEFDTVCLVGIDEQKFSLIGTSHELALEIKKIQQDLLYVALTRAISELHVLGKTTLQNYLNK